MVSFIVIYLNYNIIYYLKFIDSGVFHLVNTTLAGDFRGGYTRELRLTLSKYY